MGMFDYVRVRDPRFVCSEGHDLGGEEFQTKDFGCTMGYVGIADDRVNLENGGYGDSPKRPLLGRFDVGCRCAKCPAFVQFGTGNAIACGVNFDVEIIDDAIRSIKRTSPSAAEFVRDQPLLRHMKRCEGPMSYADAIYLHVNYRDARPEYHAEFDAWATARSAALKVGKPWPWELAVGDYPNHGDEST